MTSETKPYGFGVTLKDYESGKLWKQVGKWCSEHGVETRPLLFYAYNSVYHNHARLNMTLTEDDAIMFKLTFCDYFIYTLEYFGNEF